MIGAALVGGMTNATADVTAMGHIDTSIFYRDLDVSGVDSTTNLICTTCSFGFKGSEDLGNGLKAIFKIDFQYNTTERNRTQGGRSANVTATTTTTGGAVNTGVVIGQATDVSKGTSSLTDRDQWLGLDSGFGKLRIGTISTSYKSHGAMIDPVYRTSVQGRTVGLQSVLQLGAGDSGQGRATNTFRYDSPTFAGITATGHYTMQDDNGTDSTDNPWGLGGQWKAGGFLVFADYITSDAGGDDDAFKVGGRWGFDKFAIFGQYEDDGGAISGRTSLLTDQGLIQWQEIRGSGDGADTWFIGGTAGFGNNLIYAAYGQQSDGAASFETGDFEGESVNTKNDSWSIVGVHSMSKRTKLYAGYVQTDYDKLDKITDFSLGIKHTF